MSVIDNLRPKPAPAAKSQIPTAQEIAGQLATAESELAALEKEHGKVALDALTDNPPAAHALSALEGKLIDARGRVSRLKAAYRAAVERDEAARRAQLAALQKTQ